MKMIYNKFHNTYFDVINELEEKIVLSNKVLINIIKIKTNLEKIIFIQGFFEGEIK